MEPFSHIGGQTGGFWGCQTHFWPLFQEMFNFENIALNPKWTFNFNHAMAKIGYFGAFPFSQRGSDWGFGVWKFHLWTSFQNFESGIQWWSQFWIISLSPSLHLLFKIERFSMGFNLKFGKKSLISGFSQKILILIKNFFCKYISTLTKRIFSMETFS